MFGKIVLDVPGELFEEALHELRRGAQASPSTPTSTADDLARPGRDVQGHRREAKRASTSPTTRTSSSRHAIEAVFKSWNGRRARDYRRMEGIPDDLGTAVNVQTMVFGNKGDDSGTGVALHAQPVDR